MKNKIIVSTLSILIIVLLASCATTPRTVQVVKTEYQPIELDLQDSVDRLYETRPLLEPSIKDSSNMAVVLVAYKDFADKWMDYSFRLEDYINFLNQALKPEE